MRTRFGIFFVFISGVLFFTGFKDMIASFTKPVDLYAEDTNVKEINDTRLIEADIFASFGCFVEEETTTKNRSGAVTGRSSDFYYIVPAYNGDETYYIGIEVSEEKQSLYDKLTDSTYDYLYGYTDDFSEDAISVSGRLAKLDDEKYEYFREWFEEEEWTQEEIDEYVLPVYIETFKPSIVRNTFFAAMGLMSLGIALIVWGVISNRKLIKEARSM